MYSDLLAATIFFPCCQPDLCCHFNKCVCHVHWHLLGPWKARERAVATHCKVIGFHLNLGKPSLWPASLSSTELAPLLLQHPVDGQLPETDCGQPSITSDHRLDRFCFDRLIRALLSSLLREPGFPLFTFVIL